MSSLRRPVTSFISLISISILALTAVLASSADAVQPPINWPTPNPPAGCIMEPIYAMLEDTALFANGNDGLTPRPTANNRIVNPEQIWAPNGMYVAGFHYTGVGSHRIFFRMINVANQKIGFQQYNHNGDGPLTLVDYAFPDKAVRALRFGKDTYLHGYNSLVAYYCPIQKNADLSIIKTGPETVEKVGTGGSISYTLTVHNAGPEAAPNAGIADEIPTGLTFDPAGSDPICFKQGSYVYCKPFDLASGASKTVIVAFKLKSSVQCGGYFLNKASVVSLVNDPQQENNQTDYIVTNVECPPASSSSSSQSSQESSGSSQSSEQSSSSSSQSSEPSSSSSSSSSSFESNDTGSGSSSSSSSSSANAADLSVTKTGPETVQKGATGGTILYTLTAHNAGPSVATNVTIGDVIPAGLTFNAASSDPICFQNSINVLCNGFNLGVGESKTVQIAFDLKSSVQCGAFILNQGIVVALINDPQQDNNQTDSVVTTVECPVE